MLAALDIKLLLWILVLCIGPVHGDFETVTSGKEFASALGSGTQVNMLITEDIVLETEFIVMSDGSSLLDSLLPGSQLLGDLFANTSTGVRTLALKGNCQDSTGLLRRCDVDLASAYFSFTNGDRALIENINLIGGGNSAIKADRSVLWLSNVGVLSSSTLRRGGGVSLISKSSALLEDVDFNGNTASLDGGALHVAESIAVLRNSTFEGNKATLSGSDTMSLGFTIAPIGSRIGTEVVVLLNTTTQGQGTISTSGGAEVWTDNKLDLSSTPASAVLQLPPMWSKRKNFTTNNDTWVTTIREEGDSALRTQLEELCATGNNCRTIQCKDTDCVVKESSSGGGGSNTGAIIGGIVAALVVCALLAALYCWRQRSNKAVGMPGQNLDSPPTSGYPLKSSVPRASISKETEYPADLSLCSMTTGSGASSWVKSSTSSQFTSGTGTWSATSAIPSTFKFTRMLLDPTTKVGVGTQAVSRTAGQKLEQDLDHMYRKGFPLLNKFDLGSSSDRRQGGQGYVQFATGRLDSAEYAIKFFLDNESFRQEHLLYSDPVLQKIMPAVSDVVDNEDKELRGPSGIPFPPFIVIERGESLNEWADKSAPDFWTTMTVLQHIADRLLQLHKLGKVHRDLKPENILWRPRYKEWTLIDFGCTCNEGETANICFSPLYAAPEVILACEEKEIDMLVHASVDMWSFGVIAFELLTKSRAFSNTGTQSAVNDQIVGRAQLPWEELTNDQAQHLKLLGPSVLSMLQRNPAKRPSITELIDSWDRLFKADMVIDVKPIDYASERDFTSET